MMRHVPIPGREPLKRRNIKPRIRMLDGRWGLRPVGLPFYLYDYEQYLAAKAYCQLLNAAIEREGRAR